MISNRAADDPAADHDDARVSGEGIGHGGSALACG
jgi:hypothetical protein